MNLILTTTALLTSLLGLIYSTIEQQNLLIFSATIIFLTSFYQLCVATKHYYELQKAAKSSIKQKRIIAQLNMTIKQLQTELHNLGARKYKSYSEKKLKRPRTLK